MAADSSIAKRFGRVVDRFLVAAVVLIAAYIVADNHLPRVDHASSNQTMIHELAAAGVAVSVAALAAFLYVLLTHWRVQRNDARTQLARALMERDAAIQERDAALIAAAAATKPVHHNYFGPVYMGGPTAAGTASTGPIGPPGPTGPNR